jgi:hypothetical protein
MADDQTPNVVISGPRGPGRPKGSRVVPEPRTSVSVWLPVSTHERLTQIANQRFDGSLSAAIRHVLVVKLR